MDGMATIGLGPILMALGAVALLGVVPWIVRLVLRSGAQAGAGAEGEDEAFDADAAFARYMARKAAGGEDHAIAVDPDTDEPAVRPTFGRKVA